MRKRIGLSNERWKYYQKMGKKLRERREELSMTLEAFHKQTGIDKTSLYHIEEGVQGSCIANFRKICIALRLSADDLLELPTKRKAKIF